MSLIPRNNTPTPFTLFSQDFWDNFFSHDHFPLISIFPFPSFLTSQRTIPYSELAVETSGDVKTHLECKKIPEAHLIVAELPGFSQEEVGVDTEEGGFVKISAADGRFSWRMRLPNDAKVGLMSCSMENGVLTVVVPKFVGEMMWDRGGDSGRDVRVVEITGSDE